MARSSDTPLRRSPKGSEMSQAGAPTLSVVIPMYNEEAVLPLLAERLRPVLDRIGEPYEVVAVDDGSRDATPQLLIGMRRGLARAAGASGCAATPVTRPPSPPACTGPPAPTW